ncbi:hypothetical protein ACFLYV_02685 [Chloroflexota bacterium]
MRKEAEIKNFGLQRGANLVGIASAEMIDSFPPPGHRTTDILKGAKSVIVLAGHMAPAGAYLSPSQRTVPANRLFPRTSIGVSIAVAKHIEDKYGYASIGEIPPPVGFHPSLSQKLCAEMAGLGTRSLAGSIILNPEIGLISVSTCLTTMPLEPDGPMTTPVCPHPICLETWQSEGTVPCLKTCPECLSGEIEGGKIKNMRFDRRICTTRAQTTAHGSFLRTLEACLNEDDQAVRKSMLLGSFTQGIVSAISYGAVIGQCGECLRFCPVCIETQNLKENIIDPEQHFGEVKTNA